MFKEYNYIGEKGIPKEYQVLVESLSSNKNMS